MEAVGAYIKTMREGRNLSRVQLASKSGTNEAQILRIEQGSIDTRGSLLFAVIDAVQGVAEHVQQLMQKDATPSEGEALARAWLAGAMQRMRNPEALTSEEEEIISRLTPDQRAALLTLVRQMIRDS